MRQTPKGIERFFPEFVIFGMRPSDLGYFPICVSVFDHWLSPEEFSASKNLYYDAAIRNGKLDDYMVGEENIIAFYQHLAQHGAYVHEETVDQTDNSRIHDSYWETNADDKDLIALLRVRAREKRLLTACELYFPEFELRSLAGHDRTDILFLRNKDFLPAIEKIAKEHNLHLLNADHLDELDEEEPEAAAP